MDARIVIASVDTYLRFAEAVNRLDLGQSSDKGVPEMVEDVTSGGAESKTKGVLEGAKESLFGSSDEEEENEENGEEERKSSSRSRSGRRSGSGQRSRSRSSSRGR